MEHIIERALGTVDRAVIAIEVPPGVGKTYGGIRAALRAATRGHTVIFALPNHSSLLTAFAYAVNYLAELRRSMPKSRLPYIVYYEGIERFCPLATEEGFTRAVEEAEKAGLLTKETATRFRKLGLGGVRQVYGASTICRLLCPTYASGEPPKEEKVIIPRNTYEEIMSASGLTAGEQTAVLREAARNLVAMKELVYVAEPRPFDESNKGYCVRMALMRGLGPRKRQIIFKGALILTPVQALDYVFSLLMNRYIAVTAGGAKIPPPIVILDEYDYYVYNKADLRLVSLEHLREEVEYAKEVLATEIERRLTEGKWDVVRFVYSLLAAVLGEEMLSAVESKLGKSAVSLEAASSWESLVAEVATRPAEGGEIVVPPLAPRLISGEAMIELIENAIVRARNEVKEFAEATGITPPSLDDITPQLVLSYLQEWEAHLIMEGSEKVTARKPVLTKAYWRVLELAHARAEPFSAIRALARVANLRKAIVVYSIGERVDEILTKSGKVIKQRGVEVLAQSYDIRFAKIFASQAQILLMSATGLPWSMATFTTRSGGFGRSVGAVSARASAVITTALIPIEKWRKGFTREYAYFLVAQAGNRPIIVVTLLPEVLRAYASYARIVPVQAFQLLPPRFGYGKEYYTLLWTSLRPYVATISQVIEVLRHRKTKPKPAVLVLTQRKDVAFAIAKAVASATASSLRYCTPTECRSKPVKKNISHLLVRAGKVAAFITWLRSRMSRGVDVPPEYAVEYVFVVGSPYRPPTTFDVPPDPSVSEEARMRTTAIEVRTMIGGYSPKHEVVLAHNPIDVAESVGELVQAVGRALRRAWQAAQEEGKAWRVTVAIPYFTYQKIMAYAPLWFKMIAQLETQ